MPGNWHRMRHVKCIVTPTVNYYRQAGAVRTGSFAAAVRRGMTSAPRSIPPKFFYDSRGSDLFERICDLPEYYLTRTESAILASVQGKLASFLHGRVRLVDLGSGSSAKTRLILDALQDVPRVVYTPIDISDSLERSASLLAADYPNLEVTGVVDTYERGLGLVGKMDRHSNLVTILGSSLGNMAGAELDEFLRMVRDSMNGGDLFLAGLDMVKDTAVLEAAYNDSAGVTAQFNLNMLHRMNRELGADFDIGRFEHRAVYNRQRRRVEMYIRSLCRQTVSIPGAETTIRLGAGELIHTENSHKFTMPQVRRIASDAGFKIERLWQDERGFYSLALMSPD